jgi:hypothetical protein
MGSDERRDAGRDHVRFAGFCGLVAAGLNRGTGSMVAGVLPGVRDVSSRPGCDPAIAGAGAGISSAERGCRFPGWLLAWLWSVQVSPDPAGDSDPGDLERQEVAVWVSDDRRLSRFHVPGARGVERCFAVSGVRVAHCFQRGFRGNPTAAIAEFVGIAGRMEFPGGSGVDGSRPGAGLRRGAFDRGRPAPTAIPGCESSQLVWRLRGNLSPSGRLQHQYVRPFFVGALPSSGG